MKRFRHIADERGTSIIEILVVMVVLLVGIMSVIRMFPGGFAAVRHAESITFANRMAQAELERLKTHAENLPAGIVPVDSNGDVVLNWQHPGPPYKDGNNDDIEDNITTFRRIIGETTKIPVGTYFGGVGNRDFGSVYSLMFSPITPGSVSVYGGAWRRTTDASGPLRSFEYGIDYGNGMSSQFRIRFRPVSYPRLFRVSFSWWESVNGLRPELRSGIQPEVLVPAGWGDWIEINVPSTGVFHGIKEYSDSVARAFNEVVIWSDDDFYEFKVVDYDTGVIAFNPRGYNAMEHGVDGPRILEARIDYDKHDLSILREDRIVPGDVAGASYRVKLSLRYIKQAGKSIELNGDTYQGFTLPSGARAELVLLDLNSGWRIRYPQPAVELDYNEGVLSFAPNVEMYDPSNPGNVAMVPIAGRNIRIFYQAEGDWRIIVHKSYELYRHGTSADYMHYAHQNGQPRVEFAVCDIGKNVAVDYTFIAPDPLDTESVIEHRVVGEVHQITRTGTAGNGQIHLSRVPSRITEVYGTSLKVRVVWTQGGRGIGARFRPRYQWIDADTTLTRKPYEV